MHPEKSCSDRVASRGLRAPRGRIGPGARILLALLLGSALILPAARGGPRSASDRMIDDVLHPLAEGPGEGPRDGPAPDETDPIPTGDLTQSIDLDLNADPRPACQVEGPVEWQPGKLILGPGGSIRRALDLGPQVKLTLRLGFAPLAEDGQTSTTRLAFQIRDRGAFVVKILRRREGGESLARIQLIDEDYPDRDERGFLTRRTQTLRTFEWKGDFPDEPWTIRLHHGLQTVDVGSKRVAIGYAAKGLGFQGHIGAQNLDPKYFMNYGINRPLNVTGWAVRHDGAALACSRVTGSASAPAKVPFEEPPNGFLPQHSFVDGGAALSLRDLIDHPLTEVQVDVRTRRDPRRGPYSRREDRDAFFRLETALGARHPYHALSLAGWGMQYHWAGQDARAERLLKQAVEIGEKTLGPLHPDHTLIVSSLGQFYRDTGKFEDAQSVQTQALRAGMEVFGPRSYRNNPTLRQLALLHQDLGRFAEAETLLRQGVEASADAPPKERGDALAALGEFDARLGERDKAAALLREGQELLEKEYQRLMTGRWRLEQLTPVLMSLGNVKAQHAWVLFQAGKKGAARQLARPTFLSMCQFENSFGVNGRGHFPGWNSWMMDVRPRWDLQYYPMYRDTMLVLARLFLALGDEYPAVGCVQVLDLVYGQSHHDLATVYRIMSKVRETHPRGLVVAYTNGSTERFIRESVYNNWAAIRKPENKTAERPPEPDVYWLELALKEYEQSVGREHPETLDALQARARQYWLYEGPEKAEPTLRDSWSRAVELSDKVLPGLPEVQTYQFLEINRPPVDLMLSLYRARTGDRARDAYEVVWRSKALATRQMAERRQLAQAASARPEIARLAGELQSTRQDLARVSLAVPAGNSAELRRTQLAELTRRKEDLERELARRSEPFRRARDAERTTVAELVRHLPAQTVVVDLTERWEWTPPPPVSAVDPRPPDDSRPSPPSGRAAAPARKKATPVQKKQGAAQKKGAPVQKKQSTAHKQAAEGPRTKPAPFPLPPGRPESPPPSRASKPWARKRLYDAFVLRPDAGEPGWSAVWLGLGDADTLDRLLDGWIASVRPGGHADGALAQQLRDRLWKPIESALGDCRTVILVPDGRLAQVPWNALPGRRPDSFLIEDYALAQAPYGQYVARLLTDPAPAGNGFFLVGGIDYGPAGKWPYLKGTAVEVEQLAALRPGPDTVRLVGQAANQSRLRELMPGRRFIHLATHGEFLDPGPGRDADRFLTSDTSSGGAVFDVTARNPLVLSKLVLAGANRPAETDTTGLPVGDDGFLTAEEVTGMDLSRNELVVLSACETGAGKVRSGEGVFSLQRSFHIAGSRAVVASLWTVDDRATQALMGRFYQNLWSNPEKPRGKLEALREAQLWLLRQGAEELGKMRGGLVRPDPVPAGPLPPSYWAAFVLSGDWR